MIWLNPWALLGIIGIALPLLIHLLGRGHARVLKFPTLRFLDSSRLLPTKRSRIQDPLLLAVRIAILALAAIALAQPLLLTVGRRRALDRGLARAIIVDTSASMRRTMTSGARLMDSARTVAKSLGADAQTSIVVATDDPATAIPGAIAWVARQQRSGEIVLISDFQRGQIDRADLSAIPTAVGITLRSLSPSDTSVRSSIRIVANDRTIDAHAMTTLTGTDVDWSAALPDTSIRMPVVLFAAPADAPALTALRDAAATIAASLPIDTARAVGIVFAKYPSHDAVVSSLLPPHGAWQLRLLTAIRRTALPLTAAGNATIDGVARFVLVTNAAPTSLDAARLLATARRATSAASPPFELEPRSVSASDVHGWERAPSDVSPSQHRPLNEDAPSDGRWLWTVVLGLLVIEWRLRQLRPTAVATTEERARAA